MLAFGSLDGFAAALPAVLSIFLIALEDGQQWPPLPDLAA